jgi:hypothetical protein
VEGFYEYGNERSSSVYEGTKLKLSLCSHCAIKPYGEVHV